jgi:hypothetical protein
MTMMPLPDVLEHWRPDIEWDRFNQGPISDPAWACFKRFVLLCHALRHWEEDAQEKRQSPPRYTGFSPENWHLFEQRQDQWKAEVRQSEAHRNRARFLVDQTVDALSNVGTDAAGVAGTPDWKLGFALRSAVNAHPQAAAFECFDGEQEMKGEPDEIALRWLRRAGFKYIE